MKGLGFVGDLFPLDIRVHGCVVAQQAAVANRQQAGGSGACCVYAHQHTDSAAGGVPGGFSVRLLPAVVAGRRAMVRAPVRRLLGAGQTSILPRSGSRRAGVSAAASSRQLLRIHCRCVYLSVYNSVSWCRSFCDALR